ncbi:DUF2207 family protein [Metaclostridioides mangenotii]|uniref:Membrane protein YgcG n=1 Tax=Metaclostridioides mangenotii TaxID=1540 RepID=A0ABS4E7I4_9FIRM|nr:DUF2207 domain-containing protein [Clostridioides mangenotii]MBP1853897.1 putative membrane protein YgcG [Clostridioides mangenotii]
MKRFKNHILSLLFLFLIFFTTTSNVFAYESFQMNSYDVVMDIEEDGVIHVKESINMSFFVPSHGLYSEIPIQYKMDFGNGEKNYVFPVKNINVEDHKYSVEYGQESVVIKAGNPDYEFTGKESYVLTYDIYTRDLDLDGLQMLYMNIIPTNIDAHIYNVSFAINMPKKFDTSKINFTSGKYGNENTGNNNVTYHVEGNTIYGAYNKFLSPYEGITIKVNLEDGYFNYPESSGSTTVAMIILGALGALLLLYYIKKGKINKVIPIVSFEPPKGLNSAEIGYVIDGTANNEDTTSLVIEWATKGYLNIHEKGKNSFELEKIKDADNQLEQYEQMLFNKILYKDRVSFEDLKKKNIGEEFQATAAKIAGKFALQDNRIFAGTSGLLKFLAFILSLSVIAITSFLNNYQTYLIVSSALFMAGLISIFFTIVFIPWLFIGKYRYKMKKGKIALLYISLGLINLFILIVYCLRFVELSSTSTAISLFVILICIIILVSPTKRSAKGHVWLEEILGFKDFIKYAEKDRLELLVQEDPTYFYHVLPYAYVLGVSNVWAKKFEQLSIPKPTWYHGSNYDTFSSVLWISSFNRSMGSLRTTTVPIVKQGSSHGGFGNGGSSGGGFSGGGFGGGGRGSW